MCWGVWFLLIYGPKLSFIHAVESPQRVIASPQVPYATPASMSLTANSGTVKVEVEVRKEKGKREWYLDGFWWGHRIDRDIKLLDLEFSQKSSKCRRLLYTAPDCLVESYKELTEGDSSLRKIRFSLLTIEQSVSIESMPFKIEQCASYSILNNFYHPHQLWAPSRSDPFQNCTCV